MLALVTMAIGSILSLSIISYATFDLTRANKYKFQKQAEFLAEAGLERAIPELAARETYPGEDNYNDLSTGTYKIVVGPEQNINNQKVQQIDAEGRLPQGSTSATAKHKDKRRNKIVKISSNGTNRQTINFNNAVFTDSGGIQMMGTSRIVDYRTSAGEVRTNGNVWGGGGRINRPTKAQGSISWLLLPPDQTPPEVETGSAAGQAYANLPFFDYLFWKVAATQGGEIDAAWVNANCNPCTLGPKKIKGDVILTNNMKIEPTGPLYITGNFTMLNSSSLIYSACSSNSFDTTVMVVDGIISLHNSANASPCTPPRPFDTIILASTYVGGTGVKLENDTNAGPIVAHNTAVELKNDSQAEAAIAQGIKVSENAEIFMNLLTNSYYSGIVPPTFLYNKGSYQKIQ